MVTAGGKAGRGLGGGGRNEGRNGDVCISVSNKMSFAYFTPKRVGGGGGCWDLSRGYSCESMIGENREELPSSILSP